MLVKCNDTGGLDDLLPEPEASGAPAEAQAANDDASADKA
jgi:hypothetical protein